MPSEINLAMDIIKNARVTNADVWILAEGGLLSGTPITRDEYASSLFDRPISLGDVIEPDANWAFLKDVEVHGVKIPLMTIDTLKISAIAIKHREAVKP